MTALVHRLSARGPDDMAPLDAAIAGGRIDPAGIVAILGKTEGNGCVNDFTRAFAVEALRQALGRHLPRGGVDRVSLVMSGGTEGGLAPHWLVLERREPATAAAGRRSPSARPTPPTSRRSSSAGGPGRTGRRRASRAAMADAGIDDPADVHFVQIKCPLLTAERIAAAEAPRRDDGHARHAEIDGPVARRLGARRRAWRWARSTPAQVTDATIGRDFACGRAGRAPRPASN